MALAERRSFPETRFLEARGMVGETWSPESLVITVTLRSALVLQLREPGKSGHITRRVKNQQRYDINEQLKQKTSSDRDGCKWTLNKMLRTANWHYTEHFRFAAEKKRQ